MPRTRSTTAPARVDLRRWSWLWSPLLLIAFGYLAYHNSFNGPLVFDDVLNIRNNNQLRRLFPLWQSMWGPLNSGVAGRPVAQLSFALNYAAHQLDVVGYHVANLALHIATAIALYAVLRRTLMSRALSARFGARADVLAFAAALIWLVHPLLSDSVSYLSGRTEILGGLFLLLTLYSFIRSTAATTLARERLWQSAAVVFCILGTGCKEILAAAPFVVLLYDRIFIVDSYRDAMKRRGPMYLGLIVSLSLIPLNLYMANFHRSALERSDVLGSWDYLKTQSEVLVMYLRLSFWPDPLVIDYYGWPTHPSLISILPYAIFILLLLIATIIGVARRWPSAYVGAWFFLILAPTSSVLPLPTEVATERRMYLPLMAIVALIVLGAWQLLSRFTSKTVARCAGIALVALTVAAETWRTLSRNEVYKDPVAVWDDTIRHRPTNSRAYDNLAYELFAKNEYTRAKDALIKAIELNPADYIGMNNLGRLYMNDGDTTRAIRSLESAIRVKPDYTSPYGNLAYLYLQLGNLTQSEHYLNEAVRIEPQRIDHRIMRAKVKLAAGNIAEAESAAREALGINPDSPAAHDQLSLALARRGQWAEAFNHSQKAVNAAKNDFDIATHFAWILAVSEDPSIRNTRRAVAIATGVAQASKGEKLDTVDVLALAFAAHGDFDRAVVAGQQAISLAHARRPARLPAIEARQAAYERRAMPELRLQFIEFTD
jgi:tetratricopeptide (TPR) repeat protein